MPVELAFERAYFRLDNDLSREALPDGNGIVNRKTLSVAMSGAVSCVAHVNGPNLYIGHVGDCNAVLGEFVSVILLNLFVSFLFVLLCNILFDRLLDRLQYVGSEKVDRRAQHV